MIIIDVREASYSAAMTASAANMKPRNWLPTSPMKIERQETERCREHHVREDVDKKRSLAVRDQDEESGDDDRRSPGKTIQPIHEIEDIGQPDHPDQRHRIGQPAERDTAQKGQGQFADDNIEPQQHGGCQDLGRQLDLKALKFLEIVEQADEYNRHGGEP